MPATAHSTALPPPRVIKEKVPAPADTDRATALTVQKMCEYIRAGAADPIVQAWAHQAQQQFGAGGQTLESLCWGVWWLVKHRVRFAKDEPRLMGIGDGDALDLLIAPAVLVRQKDPAGDCDDFTMPICSMLSVLGVPWNIVVIACEPSDPSRWSHVFPVALIAKDAFPMDASHGSYPGWRVPDEHTFRWQAFNDRAQKTTLQPGRFKGLHGYTRRTSMVGVGRAPLRVRGRGFRGFGQVDLGDTDAGIAEPLPDTSIDMSAGNAANNAAALANLGTPGFTTPPVNIYSLPTGAAIAPGTPISFGSFLTSLFGTAAQTANAIVNPQPTVAPINWAGILPIVLLVGGGFLLLSAASGKKR